MRKIKNSIKMPVIAVVLAAALAGVMNANSVTTAYLTDGEDVTNRLTIGENKITITEIFNPPGDLTTGDNSFTKSVKITNTGDVDCYIRAFINFSDNDVRKNSTVSADGSSFYTMEEFTKHLPANWVYVDSADLGPYFYYTQPVKVGQTTSELLKTVKTKFADAKDVEPFDIYVYAESVQTLDKNGEAFTGSDAWKKAWTEYLAGY